jgi:hypothetical protein
VSAARSEATAESGVLTRVRRVYPTNAGDHAPEAFRSTFFKCLEALNVKKVRTLYLHAPGEDRSAPIDTLVLRPEPQTAVSRSSTP